MCFCLLFFFFFFLQNAIISPEHLIQSSKNVCKQPSYCFDHGLSTIAREWWLTFLFYTVIILQMLGILINHVRKITDSSAEYSILRSHVHSVFSFCKQGTLCLHVSRWRLNCKSKGKRVLMHLYPHDRNRTDIFIFSLGNKGWLCSKMDTENVILSLLWYVTGSLHTNRWKCSFCRKNTSC